MTTPVKRIGGSRAAACLGQSKWATPLDVFFECTEGTVGPISQDDLTADQERGIMLEPALLTWASKKLGIEFKKPEFSLVSREHSFAAVSPDGLGADGVSYLELKAPRTHDGWGDEGTDQVPGEYLLQVVHGLFVTDRKVAYIGALIGGTLKIFKHERDLELEKQVLDGERKFWENHVLAGVRPEPRYGDEQTVRRLYPNAMLPPLAWSSLDATSRGVIEQWYGYNRARIDAEKFEDAWRVSVLALLQGAAGVEGFPLDHPIKRIDCKQIKAAPNAGTWKAVATELLASLPESARAELVEKHTPKEGARVLRLYENRAAPKEKP